MADSILILASSYKPGGRCVAGKSMATKRWVRIVGNAQGAALTLEQTVYQNSYGEHRIKPLLKITMDIGDHVPMAHQPENFLMVPGWMQTRGYSVKAHELQQYSDAPPSLWGEGDRVADLDIVLGTFTVEQSLYLVRADDIFLHRNGDRRRVSFTYNTVEYNLSGTDPNYDKFEDGTLVPNGYLCVSLGEDFNGEHYKIVATIFGDPAQ